MDVLTGERMKKVDEDTIARFYPGLELMERAGRSLADFVISRYPAKGFKASIFVGPGNNGGDALVLARLLAEAGRKCSVHYLVPPDKFTMDALKNYQRLQNRMHDTNLKEINWDRPDWKNVIKKDLISCRLVVDGIFGTGLSRDVEGRARDVIGIIDGANVPVLSIDIPSGIHADTGRVLGTAVHATHTVTMGHPKLGMLFHPGKEYVGELAVADLGFPDEVLQVHSLGIYLLDRREAARRLPERVPDAHKYTAGTVVVMAGSRAFAGAAMLAVEAALRSGAGMVYAAVPECIRTIVQGRQREAIVVGLPDTPGGAIAVNAISTIAPYLAKCQAAVIGPGLTTDPETVTFVADILAQYDGRLVIDADGLNALAGRAELLRSSAASIVVTPHSGELERLLETPVPGEPLARVEITRETAKRLGVTLVHKGAPTIISSPEGDAWISHHGTSALATAGSGDVLAGFVAGMQAQGAPGLDAAALGCFLQARAGELAAEERGVRGVIAGDLLEFAGRAMRELENRTDLR